MSDDTPHILTERSGAVLRITLNRPKLRNAMTADMATTLLDLATEAAGDPDLRLIILRGAGGHFCAGGDIKDMQRMIAGSGEVEALSAVFGRMCAAFDRLPQAVVTVVEGTVMGGGFGLACVSDITIAAPSAKFALPETSRGLLPAQIMPFLLQRVGYAQTRRLAVRGGVIGAEEALRIGLAHEVTDNPDAALGALQQDILTCAPEALARTKAMARDLWRTPPADPVADAATQFAQALAGPEGREGIAAFVEKRPPAWTEPRKDA